MRRREEWRCITVTPSDAGKRLGDFPDPVAPSPSPAPPEERHAPCGFVTTDRTAAVEHARSLGHVVKSNRGEEFYGRGMQRA